MRAVILTVAVGFIGPALIVLIYCYSHQIDSFMLRLFSRAVGLGVGFFVAYFAFLIGIVVWRIRNRNNCEH